MSIYYDGYFGLLRNDQPMLQYIVSVAAASKPLSLTEVKTHLRLPLLSTAEDTMLNAMIDAITNYTEQYTRRDMINKTYTAFADCFPPSYVTFEQVDRGKIEIQRSKLQSITSVQYLTGGVLTTVSSSVYYNTNDPDFSSIYLVDGQDWPTDVDIRKQAIKITFVAGYGAAGSNVPADLKLAMLEHIAAYYENRGDCADCSLNIPALSRMIYDKNKIYKV
jgi:uncharacterized phiE125 gp8 family phage protein